MRRPALRAWQFGVIVLLLAAILGGAIYFGREVLQPRELVTYSRVPWVDYVHPNVPKLEEARALVEQGEMTQARDLLIKALTVRPKSPVTREMRDLLGEINTQIFFSSEQSPRKTEYTVRSGDALSAIARKLKSSTDLIMRVNNLDSSRIFPGDKLAVPQLDFTVTIDLPRERVVVHDSKGFFTQYRIAAAELPASKRPRIETKVKAKSFWQEGEPVRRTAGSDALPRIHLSRNGYVLYGVEEESEEPGEGIDVESDSSSASEPRRGIAMLKEDITELALLLGKGAPVTVILDER